MLLIIAAAGIIITIAACRKPEVTFFSVITIFNRKEKLTQTGARLYVGFFVLLIIAFVLNFLRASTPTAAASVAPQNQAENADGAAAPRTKEEQFADMTRYFEMEAETMASIMPTNGMAEGQMEICNSFMQGGLIDYKADRDLQRLHVAVRDCHQIVLKACAESTPANGGHCEEYKVNTRELRNW